MKLTFLGTAGSYLRVDASNPAILIDDCLLLDCGEGTAHRLLQVGSIDTVRLICLSHLHLDHVAGVFSILWHRWIRKIPHAVRIIGPPATEKTLEAILALVRTPPAIRTSPIHYDFPGLSAASFQMGKYTIDYIWVHHEESSALAYRIDDGTRAICYSGDTSPTRGLIDLARDCDLLICEATFPDEHRAIAHRIGHSTPSDAAYIASEAGCDRLVLFHISSYFADRIEEFQVEAERGFPAVTVARDLMVMEV